MIVWGFESLIICGVAGLLRIIERNEDVWGFESLIICGVAGLLRIIERNEDMQKISAGTAAWHQRSLLL